MNLDHAMPPPRATMKQVRYLMELLEDAGYTIQTMDQGLHPLMRDHEIRSLRSEPVSVERWLKGLSRHRASELIDRLQRD